MTTKFWTKQDIRALVNEHQFQSVEHIQATLKDMFKDVLEATLKAELDTQLDYAPYDQNKQTKNSRNGYGKKTIHTEYGDMEIQVPRDRLREFELVVIKKNQTNMTRIEDQITALYAKGVSTRDIQSTPISNVTNKVMSLIIEWYNRPLQPVYAVMFLDAIHFKVKQDWAIVNKAAYMVIGVDLDGNKNVLGIWIGENESAKFWMSVLNDLKNRGVQDIIWQALPRPLVPVIRKQTSKNVSFIKSEIRYDMFLIKI
jgi:putative transposase